MIDITIIRDKPEWVKEQILKLQDEPAAARIDTIIDLDKRRRALLTETETIQAERNKLNKAMGRFRGSTSRRAMAASTVWRTRMTDGAMLCCN